MPDRVSGKPLKERSLLRPSHRFGFAEPDRRGGSLVARLLPRAERIAGYADMIDEHMEALRKRKVSILTVIFGDGDEECEALAPFGPVMKLEDVVEACGSA